MKKIIYMIMIFIALVSIPSIFIKTFTAISSKSDAKALSLLSQKPMMMNLKKISAYNDQHKIEPIDAKIDKVWKAIPGYNGLEVDIEASYKNMKPSTDIDTNKIIFKETSPKIHLRRFRTLTNLSWKSRKIYGSPFNKCRLGE